MTLSKVALEGGYVITPDGMVEGGIVLIHGTKIHAVTGLAKYDREKYTIIDCRGMVVSPGLIDPHTHLGLYAEGSGEAGEDGNEMTDPVTPHLRAIDGVDHADRAFAEAREAGVTAVMVTPGSANVFAGQALVMKTAGGFTDDMILDPYVGQKMAFGENPKRVYGGQKKTPGSRMGIAGVIRETLVAAQNYRAKMRKKVKPDRDLKLEALVPLLDGKTAARAHAHRADDILTAIRIAEEFSLKLVIEHGTEAYKVASVLAAKKIPVNVGPTSTGRSKVELKDLERDNAVRLMAAGVRVSLITDHPVMPIADLRQEGIKLVRDHGVPLDTVLHTLTTNPAMTLGLDHRIGAIRKGMDADLALFNGFPTDPSAVCMMTFIDGKPVYVREGKVR
ncbi:MAG: amidohydrolase family protein [Nitrospinae bacterium]|nr:amidohydrolase family protein [Nitrospinota bacterium]